MSLGPNYEQQFLDNFEVLIGQAPGLPQKDFVEILLQMPNAPSRDAIEAAFKRHSDNGKHIDSDCMLEAAAELTDSSSASLISMTLVHTIERMQWRKLFNLVDEDGSGKVDIHELKSFVDALSTVLQLHGYNNQDAAKWMREVGQSEIDFETFVTVARRLTKGTPVVTVCDKVEEAKRAVRERKATALNLFQTRVLTSMLRKRGNTIKQQGGGAGASLLLSGSGVFVDPLESTFGVGGDHLRSISPDPDGRSHAAAASAANSSFVRGTSPSGGSSLEFELQQCMKHESSIVSPLDINSAGIELSRLVSSDPFARSSGSHDASRGGGGGGGGGVVVVSSESSHVATVGRVASVTHCHDSVRILSLLDQYCKQDDKRVFDPVRVSRHVTELCAKIQEAVNGPPGTLFEMQRAAVSRGMELANEFLTKISSSRQSPHFGAAKNGGGGGSGGAGIVVPSLKLPASGAASPSSNAFAGGGRERTISTISAGSHGGGGRSRARTIMESNFGREQLHEVAQDKLDQLEDARREVGSAQEDLDYAINQIVLPRNKIVELAMALIPHARNPTALATSIRKFELQTQELYDCLAYFRFFSDMGGGKRSVGFSGGAGGGAGSGFGSSDSIDDELVVGGGGDSSRQNKSPFAAAAAAKFSVLQLMKLVKDERWGESVPSPLPDKVSELTAEATVHVAFVTEALFRGVSSPTAWMKEINDVAADLGVQAKALQSSFLRDRAVQTPTELLISLQSFPVSFALKSSTGGGVAGSAAASSSAGGGSQQHQRGASASDADKNEATLREKRRIAFAQNRIRRSLVSDITRAAESVDLLIKRYLSAGVIVPPNFGRVISTDPSKQKRHTFRFGSRLIDITPMDDRLAVHSSGGYMYFDEFCGKFTDLECKRVERDERRNPALNASINSPQFQSHHHHHSTNGSNHSAPGASRRTGSAGDQRSTSAMTQTSTYSHSSPSQARSGSNLTASSSYYNSYHRQQQQQPVVEFTVRSGSPVQVVPFPGLAEANSRSISALAQQEMRSHSNNSSTNNNNNTNNNGNNPSSSANKYVGMVPSREDPARRNTSTTSPTRKQVGFQ